MNAKKFQIFFERIRWITPIFRSHISQTLRVSNTVNYMKFIDKNCHRTFSTNKFLCESHNSEDDAVNKQKIGKLEGKLKIMFTCKKCHTRNHKIFSKLAYEKGIVIIRCDGCKNNHLIADNLGWFSEITHGKINIEKILAKQGEEVKRIINDVDGYFEVTKNEDHINADETSKSEEKNQDNVNLA